MLARGGSPLAANWQQIDLSLPKEIETSGERDFFAAALESPLTADQDVMTTIRNPDMNLCASSEELQILENSGFDILSFNNNHQNDCFEAGALETQRLLEEAGFSQFQPTNGIWIAHLRDSDLSIIAVDEISGIVNEKGITETIRKEKNNDKFVIVSVHWGNEYQTGPDDKQQMLAQEWVDAGADVIWGHHPHVLQRIDWITSNVDNHSALVMYSLGNLLADQFMLPDTQRSALIRVAVVNDRIKKITIIPTVFDWNTLTLDFTLKKDEEVAILDRLKLKPIDEVEIFPDGN